VAARAPTVNMPRNIYYNGPKSDHFDGERFFIRGITRDKTRGEFLRWRLRRGAKAKWPKRAASPFRDHPPERVEGSTLRVSYVGHASVLIQTRGLNILIDPVWAERASPLKWAGPKRVNAPGISLENLPKLDAVLVSHNHYDHLDLVTLSKLAKMHAPRVLTPLGNDVIMRRHDKHIDAEAFDWGARVPLNGEVAVHFEPAYHWSARGLRDRRMALWCAFVIETPDGAIYHIADTGWGDGAIFSAAREKHGDIRLAILPIGAYEPRWFMRDQHVNPEESLRVFQLCGARRAMAHHWGTFQLTDEAIDEPPRALREAMKAAGVADELFRVCRPGEAIEVA
jgi:L-ascorbate metabolism protein UlaG (beta-lactamase superfamily)